MRDLNTVGLKSVAESKRNVKMGGPRPSYGPAGNDVNQGHYEHGRLGDQGIGPKYLNSYITPKSKTLNTPLTITLEP